MGKKIHVGKIKGNDLLINRAGKLNAGEYPSLMPKVHKSKKDYNRQREKKKVRDLFKDL